MSECAVDLAKRKCKPCEGGAAPLTQEQAEKFRKATPDWALNGAGTAIRREWICRNFMAAIQFFGKVAAVAEEEGHHPDLHLTGYRKVVIELSTHAIGGLSENDFIVAAKIDQLPVELKLLKKK
jgi:4a-hydroxytetrahydrobiopterin dehydratase